MQVLTLKNRIHTKKSENTPWIGIYVALILLTPILNMGIGVPVRIDDIFLLLLIIKTPPSNFLRPNFINIILLCFTLSCLTSLVSNFSEGKSFSFSDANDVLVLVRLFLISAVMHFFIKKTAHISQVLNWIYGAINTSIAVAIIQYLHFPHFSYYLTKLYSQGDKYLMGFMGYRGHINRTISTYGNPNFAGLFFSIGAICNVYRTIYSKGNFLINISIFVLIVFLCLVALSSRTSIILLAVTACLYVSLHLTTANIPNAKKVPVILAIICTPFLIYYGVNLIPQEMIPTRISTFLNTSTTAEGLYNSTMLSRSANWTNVLAELSMRDQLFFGNGPGPSFIIDSSFLYIFYTQGALGLLLLCFLWCWPIFTYIKLRRTISYQFAPIIFTVLIALITFSFIGPIIYHPKAGPFATVILSLWQVLLNNSKDQHITAENSLKREINR